VGHQAKARLKSSPVAAVFFPIYSRFENTLGEFLLIASYRVIEEVRVHILQRIARPQDHVGGDVGGQDERGIVPGINVGPLNSIGFHQRKHFLEY
jgi:hypothetical protein